MVKLDTLTILLAFEYTDYNTIIKHRDVANITAKQFNTNRKVLPLMWYLCTNNN
jgi:hypothetical protein